MRIWCVSDTHGMHWNLIPPNDVTAIIVAGDYTNSMNRVKNYEETQDFLAWLANLPYLHKIIVAGNHDMYTEYDKRIITESNIEGIQYLEHSTGYIENLKVFGSPYTPTFGNGWVFNKKREKLDNYWQAIPQVVDIVVTHGPPKGILDLSHDRDGKLEYCGDKALFNHIIRTKPQYHIFGHIHNTEHGDMNQGKRTWNNLSTTFVNASCVTDGQFDKGPSSNGVIIEI